MRHIDVGGHRLRAHSSGEGGRHLLCLHGLVDTLEIWDRVAPALRERGRICLIDQRGHGGSDAPPGPYSRVDLAADVIGVLDDEGVQRSILVGHSMGGIVAMATALAHPERIAGLVLIGSTSRCAERIAQWYEVIALAGETDGTAGIVRTIYGDNSKKQIRGDAQGIAHVTRMLKTLFDDPLSEKLSRITCPVLVMVGEKDPMGPKASKFIHAALPEGRAELRTLGGRGHWLHVEAADDVVAAIDDWLTQNGL
ncbi:MAG: alpha/beta hydrolase [Deltaproteobacteria bacterium]|jgi:3-oxoadipate enol-lactonase|nr:alpha/beta hydrolase [Deltaproteobacteria bacterium]